MGSHTAHPHHLTPTPQPAPDGATTMSSDPSSPTNSHPYPPVYPKHYASHRGQSKALFWLCLRILAEKPDLSNEDLRKYTLKGTIPAVEAAAARRTLGLTGPERTKPERVAYWKEKAIEQIPDLPVPSRPLLPAKVHVRIAPHQLPSDLPNLIKALRTIMDQEGITTLHITQTTAKAERLVTVDL